MALTEGAFVDRIRDLLADLGYHEAVGRDLSKTPATEMDQAFVVTYAGDDPIGQIGYQEEARGRLTLDVARTVNNDRATAARAARDDARLLLAAIVQDGAVTSGEYAVETAGRTLEIEEPDGAAYVCLRLTVPVNFEAVLI